MLPLAARASRLLAQRRLPGGIFLFLFSFYFMTILLL
jgi:hypothetical protein